METSFADCDAYVWRQIAQYLHLTDRVCLRMTCKYFAQIIARTKLTWSTAPELIYGYVARNMSPIEMLTYRDHASDKPIKIIDSRENAEHNKNITYLRANIAHTLGDLAITISREMFDQLYALSCRSELELDTIHRMCLLRKARNGELKIARFSYDFSSRTEAYEPIDPNRYPLAILCAHCIKGEKFQYWQPPQCYSAFRMELFRECEFARNTSGMWNAYTCLQNISHDNLMALSRAIIGQDDHILARAREFAQKVSNREHYDDFPIHIRSSQIDASLSLEVPICSRDHQVVFAENIVLDVAQLRQIARVGRKQLKRAIIVAFAVGKLPVLRAQMFRDPELVLAFRELWHSCSARCRTSAISKCYCAPWDAWIRSL